MARSTSLRHRVARFGAATALAILSVGGVNLAAGAATTTTVAPSATAPPGVEVLNGVTVGPARVTAPGKPTRTLTADQATSFLQTWLPSSIVEKLAHVPRPKNLTVYTLSMQMTFQKTSTPIAAFYASDGTNVFVGMPAQTLPFAAVASEIWIRSPEPAATIRAFEGKRKGAVISKPAPSTTATTTTTSPGTKAPTGKSSGSSSNTWLWFVIPGVIVVGGGAILALRSRSKTA